MPSDSSVSRRTLLAGGVAANRRLRERVSREAQHHQLHFRPPDLLFCTDNAAMIAYAGWCHLVVGHRDGLDLDSFARRPLSSWL